MNNTRSFSKNTYIENEPIIVYGASVYGELAYITLKQVGLTIDFYCDKSHDRKKYFGVQVIHPKELDKYRNANIIIASADFFCEIKKELENLGCIHLYDMVELLQTDIPKEELSNRALEMYANRQYYVDIVRNQSRKKLIFNRIQFVVSERCSLKCRDCTHLMQYYQKPQDIDLNKYKAAFDLLLEVVDYVAELRILGGEPFMNRDMHQIISWYHDNSKIGGISIYTNGTIIPDTITLLALQNEKVKIHISNYNKVNEEKLQKLACVLDTYHITYFVREYDEWQDAGNIECRNYSLEQKKAVFSRCFERNGYTFLKGQLHRCPRVAHAMNLKAIPDMKGDYVDLEKWNGTKEVLKEHLKELQARTWLEGCNYCGGPNNHTQGIPAGRQVQVPLDYKKM